MGLASILTNLKLLRVVSIIKSLFAINNLVINILVLVVIVTSSITIN